LSALKGQSDPEVFKFIQQQLKVSAENAYDLLRDLEPDDMVLNEADIFEDQAMEAPGAKKASEAGKPNPWERVEEGVTHIINTSGNPRISSERKGGEDSTSSDVLVKVDGQPAFLVETKLMSGKGAKGGQFVIEKAVNGKYVAADKALAELPSVRKILEELNKQAAAKKIDEVQQKDIYLDFTEDLNHGLVERIRENYKDKKAEHIAYTNKADINSAADIIVIPVDADAIAANFSITASIRRKKSGPHSAPANELAELKAKLPAKLAVIPENVIKET